MEVATRFASLNASKTDMLVVNKDSTIAPARKKLQKLQLNCPQVLCEKEQVKRLSLVN